MCPDLAQALPLSQEAVLIAPSFLPRGEGGYSSIPTLLVSCSENSWFCLRHPGLGRTCWCSARVMIGTCAPPQKKYYQSSPDFERSAYKVVPWLVSENLIFRRVPTIPRSDKDGSLCLTVDTVWFPLNTCFHSWCLEFWYFPVRGYLYDQPQSKPWALSPWWASLVEHFTCVVTIHC